MAYLNGRPRQPGADRRGGDDVESGCSRDRKLATVLALAGNTRSRKRWRALAEERVRLTGANDLPDHPSLSIRPGGEVSAGSERGSLTTGSERTRARRRCRPRARTKRTEPFQTSSLDGSDLAHKAAGFSPKEE